MAKVKIPDYDDFFSTVSKVVIIIPVIILILALILKYNQTTKSTATNVKNYQLTTTPKVSSFAQKKANFDLKGPYVCGFKDKEQEVKAYIKNKNVFATVVKKNIKTSYLLKGDCLYVWEGENKTNSKKTCGLSSYVSLAESMIINNLSGFESMASQYTKGNFDINAVINSCRKEEFEDSVFNLP